MIKTSRTVRVEAMAGGVWELVLDLVDHPLKYMPLAVSAAPVKRSGGTARSVIGVFGFKLKELVRLDETQRIATWVLEDNADWAGYREMRVAAGPKRERLASATLTMSFSWVPLSAKARAVDLQGLEKLIEGALARFKGIAEQRGAGTRR